jgi:hypothetical protein
VGLCGVGRKAYSHRGDLTVSGGGVPCFADGEIEERQKVENIGKGGVEAIVVGRVSVAYVIKCGD